MKILCIIPCYNAQYTLKGAIKSIVGQSYTNWELIIVDDASKDKSYNIAQSYAKKYPNITILKNNTNQGCYYSRNRALYYMKDKEWDVFTVHDADDTSSYDRFKIYTDAFIQHPLTTVAIGVFNGIRCNPWSNPKPKYCKAGSAVGTNWYKKDIFNTFGYFDDTRFGGDSEYLDRIHEFLLRKTSGDGHDFMEIRDKAIKKLHDHYAYTYTTGFHPSGNLTQVYKKPERKQYKDNYTERHQSYNTSKEFYQKYTPHKKDL